MQWQTPNIWQGREVWIIGGGSSITEQFNVPMDVRKKVQSGQLPVSALSAYMSAIHNKIVIGVNMAFQLGDWIDVMFFGDKDFVEKVKKAGLEKEFDEFKGLKISAHSSFSSHPTIKYIRHSKPKKWGISDSPHTVCWNHNSGAAAISVAVNAGAKKIVLLGFDMKTLETPHFHNCYGNTVPSYTTHLQGFAKIAEDAKKRGVEIINASPDSAITQFKKVPVSALVEEAVRDVPKEVKTTMFCSVYNELPYLPTVIKFWEAQGVDCYIIDNFSNDGTWEWLQEHKIKSHRFSTNDSFDLVALLQEITKTIHEVKPDWVIYGAADMYYWYGAPIKEVIKTAIENGCDVITGNSYSAKLVTEFVSSDWFENMHFEVGKRKWRMVAKYVPELELNIDAIDVPNPCVFKTNGILLNYGAVKPIAEQEIRFKRRKKAWEQGLSKELGVHYAKNHEQNYIFDSKALVDIRSTTAYKDFQQVKALCSTRAKTTKVGIVIPTCSKERKLFVDFLESRLQKQTVKPDVIAKIDYPNTTTKPDLAKRYREGAKKCFDAGCDFVLFIEDDDYYPLTYIEEMTKAWEDAERPCLIGHDETIYYHILSKGYKYHSTTLKHTSAFCTGITKKVAMGAKVCADTNAFIDIALWNRNKGVQVHLEHPPIGIKHGIGKTGGAFHDDKRYKLYDSDCSLLKTLVDEEAFEFYTNLEYI